jgi:hypothetical protein
MGIPPPIMVPPKGTEEAPFVSPSGLLHLLNFLGTKGRTASLRPRRFGELFPQTCPRPEAEPPD